MFHRHRLLCLAALASLAVAPTGRTQEPVPDPERARLADAILRRAEAGARRDFDPAFRQAAQRRLAGLPLEELSGRETRGLQHGIGPLELGDPTTQLLYTPVAPCRVVDTRLAGGPLSAGSARDLRVTGAGLQGQGGNPAGCNVPLGPATAAIINFVAINPVGPGNLRAWAHSDPPLPPPTASILNYPFGLTLANGIAVPLCDVSQTSCAFDIKVQADVNGAHLVADVVGYFERFPKEAVRSFSVMTTGGTATVIGSTCTHVTGMQVTVSAPSAGTVVVRGVVPIDIGHVNGGNDLLVTGLSQSLASCAFAGEVVSRVLIPGALPTAGYQDTVPVLASFEVAAGSHTFYLNAVMADGGTGNDSIVAQQAGLEATFHPDN